MSRTSGQFSDGVPPPPPPNPDDVNPSFGVSNLDKKQQIIEDNYQGDVGEIVGEIGESLLRFIRNDLPTGTNKALKVVKSVVTPGFVKRANARKIHTQNIEDRDRKLDRLNAVTKSTISRELAAKKAQRQQDKIIRELIEARKHLREEAKEVLHEAEAEQIEQEFRSFHARREAQLKEEQAKKQRAREEQLQKEEHDALEHRKWRIGFYSDQAKGFAQEIVDRHEDDVRRARNKATLDRTFDEWEARDAARTRLQVDAVPASKPIGLPGMELSIFGKDHTEVLREERMQRKQATGRSQPTGVGIEDEDDLGGTGDSADGSGSKETARQAAALKALKKDEEDELYLEEVDQHDAFVFSSEPHTEFEVAKIAATDSQTKLQRTQELYGALQEDSSTLKQSIERMLDMKEQLERDLRQVNQEILVIEKAQTGPPRRMPMAWEIPEMDNWKSQAARLYKRIADLQYALDKAQERKNAADSQAVGVAKEVAVLQEQLKSQQSEMDGINGKLGLLPMVIGRNISKVPGNGVTAKPQETFQAITHQSRLVSIKHGSDQAAVLHKDKGMIEQEIWLNRVDESNRKQHLEIMISRMSKISDKLKQVGMDNMRVNLIDALKAFIQSGTKLHQVYAKLVGVLPWYKHHDYKHSLGITRYIAPCPMGGISFEKQNGEIDDDALSNGVTMGPYKEGWVSGHIELPKDCLWNIIITISRQGYGPEFDSGNQQDFVSVKLGPTLGSVGHIGTYFNQINPETGTVLYDVKHVFRGKSFAFRFDFSSGSDKTEHHLCVSSGMYEEFELAAMEEVPDPKLQGRTRVLSSYVKMLRIEERTGKLRETKLLEELIAVEESSAIEWDSELLTQVTQRYTKEYFLRILKAEILLQQEESAAERAKQAEEQAKVRKLMVSSDLEREAAMEHSKKQYVLKKRAAQRKLLDDGRALVNKRLLLWDDKDSSWRNITVLDCIVMWVENGLKAKVLHLVQEYDDGNQPLGEPKEVDLTAFKYFESPQQTVDVETVRKWQERKKWKEAMEAIDKDARTRVDKLRKSLVKLRRGQEREFRKGKERVFALFESSVEERARDTVELPVAKRALKVLFHKTMIDIKKGLVTVDETQNLKEEARKVAKERFVQDWIQNRRQELIDQFNENEAELMEYLDNKTTEVEETCDRILAKAAEDKEEYQNHIRQQMAEAKAVMLRLVKWPKEVFQKAVPKAYNCEHLRTKAWGNNYGIGVKCLTCGKELSDLYKEESQILGYGSGADPELYEAVNRHRENEQSFKFKSAEELALVESERVRLEKERRVMDEQEMFFYDFEDLPVIYDFDRRHQRELKAAGLFRQGLQWKQDELEMFQSNKIAHERQRLKRLGLPESLLEDFDPLSEVANPAPTFRAVDERHRAQYAQMVYSVGRLHNFNKRIGHFKMERFELLTELDVFGKVLEALHKDSYLFEHDLCNIERDMDRTAKLISTYKAMQRLWQQATLIQNQAKREKSKAEMRIVGLADDVQECFERHAVLHDETRNLLRLKLLTDAKLDRQEKVVEIRRKRMDECQKAYEQSESKASALRYCMPGNLVYTRFGQLYITQYRPEDDMVIVVLPFGNPRAKATLHYKEIVEAERARQQAERLLMHQEDEAMMHLVAVERVQTKKERYLMQKSEEGLKQYYEFIDLGRNEDRVIKGAIDSAVSDTFEVTESKLFNDIAKKMVEKQVKADVDESKMRRREYKGPPSGRPAAMSYWEIRKHRKKLDLEMKTKFIKAAAEKADNQIKSVLLQARSDWVQSYSFEVMINTVIGEMIGDVAREAFREGQVAKGFAEKRSGIIFPQPTWMQYGTYASLSSIWRHRKEALERDIEIYRGETAKLIAMDPAHSSKREESLEPEQVRLRKLEKRRKKLEKLRQQRLCAEMQREELIARDFYRYELKVNLSERRLMREEDAASRQMRQAERDRLLEEQKAYEAMGGVLGADGKPTGEIRLTAGQKAELEAKRRGNTLEQRRIELKELTLERRRKEEDRAMMVIEDEMSRQLRDIDRIERARKLKQAKQGGEPDSDEEEEPQQENKESVEYLDRWIAMNPRKVLPIPPWLKPPKGFRRWLTFEKNNYIKMMTLIRAKKQRIEQLVEQDERRIVKAENRSLLLWEDKVKVARQQEMEAELDLMESEEALKEQEAKLIDVKDNMRRVLMFCREKGEEELRCRSELRKRQEIQRKREEELKEADAWLQLCIRRGKNRDKLKRRVTADCKWVDTDSINGFHQRFATELLRERLYLTYFRQIVAAIINRAEVIATERRIMGLQERLSVNKERLVERKKLMGSLLGDIRREERMRMRRSMLNERFFPKSRKAVLQQRFGGWVRFFLWNRGHREAFQLKYEVIKRQLDIDRQFKEQLRKQEEEAKKGEKAGKDGSIRTLMQRHRERPVQCRNCRRFYLESQNTSSICQFHPKQFVMECPSSCPNPGLTVLCASHRLRRWTCCDAIKQDAPGCSRRYHCPPASDPVYDAIMAKVNQRDKEELEQLDKDVVEARTHNWPERSTVAKRSRIYAIEDALERDRKTAARYKDLKFI